jgi:hypothetical protein
MMTIEAKIDLRKRFVLDDTYKISVAFAKSSNKAHMMWAGMT